MRTRCPNCKTLYRLSVDQLDLAAGLVRCGQCLCVFRARTDNVDSESGFDETIRSSDNDKRSAGSDTDPFFRLPDEDESAAAADRDRPEDEDVLPVLVAQRDEAGADHEPRAPDQADRAPPATSVDDDDRPELILHGLAADQAASSGRGRPLLTLATVLLLLALALQLAWYERANLARIDWLQPLLEQVCEKFDCDIAERRDLDSIQLLDRSVSSHPSVDKALIISATMVNNAAFRQPFPLLMVSLSDIRGQIVARRHFRPADYLDPQLAADGMVPGAPVAVVLEVTDPGGDALTFELEFF